MAGARALLCGSFVSNVVINREKSVEVLSCGVAVVAQKRLNRSSLASSIEILPVQACNTCRSRSLAPARSPMNSTARLLSSPSCVSHS
jgi:hypothetical protein